MIGALLSLFHKALYRVGGSVADACDPAAEADPYWEAQNAFDRRRDEARRSHAPVAAIEAERREWLHNSLKRAA